MSRLPPRPQPPNAGLCLLEESHAASFSPLGLGGVYFGWGGGQGGLEGCGRCMERLLLANECVLHDSPHTSTYEHCNSVRQDHSDSFS